MGVEVVFLRCELFMSSSKNSRAHMRGTRTTLKIFLPFDSLLGVTFGYVVVFSIYLLEVPSLSSVLIVHSHLILSILGFKVKEERRKEEDALSVLKSGLACT